MATMAPVRHCMTLLLLLAYVCQSLAAVGAPCAMMAPASPEISAAMPGMDHSGHAMGSADQAEAGSGNCCEDGFLQHEPVPVCGSPARNTGFGQC